MIRHIVLVRFREEIGEHHIEALFAEIKKDPKKYLNVKVSIF